MLKHVAAVTCLRGRQHVRQALPVVLAGHDVAVGLAVRLHAQGHRLAVPDAQLVQVGAVQLDALAGIL
jgi:hypothetical protein